MKLSYMPCNQNAYRLSKRRLQVRFGADLCENEACFLRATFLGAGGPKSTHVKNQKTTSRGLGILGGLSLPMRSAIDAIDVDIHASSKACPIFPRPGEQNYKMCKHMAMRPWIGSPPGFSCFDLSIPRLREKRCSRS